jgi:Family of unknown function (DUF6412)
MAWRTVVWHTVVLRTAGWSTVAALVVELWRAIGHFLLASPGIAISALAVAVLAGAIAACLVCAAWLGRLAAAVPLTGRASALREKSWRAAFLRQRDPDAAGRPRPRAPSAAPAAA